MSGIDKGFFRIITDNGTYKIVALVVALVLWVTMQGRRDIVLTREMQMQVLLGTNLSIANSIPEVVKVEIVGPRIALKKMAERTMPFTVDLGNVRPGRHVIRLNSEGLNLPLGAKVLSISPQNFTAVIVESGKKKVEE